MTTPPDFGGREIEEGLLEDLGGPRPEHPADHEDEDSSTWSGNEAHAPGKVCELCGQPDEILARPHIPATGGRHPRFRGNAS